MDDMCIWIKELSRIRTFLSWQIILLLFMIVNFTLASDSCLVEDGHSDYIIVIPDNAIASEHKAAEELQYYIQQMTDIVLPISKETGNHNSHLIAVGFNNNLPDKLKLTAYGEFSEDELIIDTAGNTLLLAGGRLRGTLYAVYEYLYRLGVRWYTPDYTKIPKQTDISLPETPYRYCPPAVGRKLNVGNHADNAWRAHNRITCNTLWSPLGEEYGGFYAEGPDMHTFWRLVPKSVLQKHPDWLVEIDGKRELPVGRTWGLCLSNQEVRKYVIDRTLDYARKNPAKSVIWVGQNDGSQYCTCDKCKAFYAAHGGKPSSLVVKLVNELSDAMAKNMPDRIVKTLAYSWSLEPPENMTLRDNVIIMFCASGSFFHPIATDPECAKLRSAVSGWRQLAKQMDVYFYFPYEDYWSPAPCTFAGADNIKWCAKNGFNRFYAAISGSGNTYGSESMNIRAWVYARLMWNSDLEVQPLIDEFIRDYYGPASPVVAQATQLIHQDNFKKDGSFKKQNDSTVVPNYVNPQKVHRINQIFGKMYDSLPEGIYKKRFSFAWISYLWADFWLGFKQTGKYDSENKTWSVPMEDGELRNRYARRVKKFMIEHGVNALNDSQTMNIAKLGIDKMGIDLPACLLQDGSVEAVVIPGLAGRIFGFQDKNLNFLPLKEFWQGFAMEYPLSSTTEESVNGRRITDYKLITQTSKQVVLHANMKDAVIRKRVSLDDGILTTDFSLEAKKSRKFSTKNFIVFDLAPDVFGFYPKIFIEQTDGKWTKKTMGIETDFWWIGGDLNLANATGRIVIQQEAGQQGILLTIKPKQLEKLSYWYSRYRYRKETPEEYCGMLRLFLTTPAHNLTSGEKQFLFWSLQILDDANKVIR